MDQVTVASSVRFITSFTGIFFEPVIGPARPGDIVHSQAAIDLARSALGYEPVVPFYEGISRTVAWYVETAGQLTTKPDRSPAPGA